MKKQLIFPLAVLVLLSACNGKKQEAEKQETIYVSTVKAGTVTYRPLLGFPGNVLANMEASLGATLPGRVEKIAYPEGSKVQKGAILAELSGEMLIQAEVEYDAIKKDYERIARLKDKGSVSQMEFDHLKAKLDASEAKVAMMRKNTQVIAPFSGTIVDIFVKEGENYSLLPSIDQQNMTVKTGIMRLMQLNPVKITFDINEKDLSRIKTGQEVSLSVDAFPGRQFRGKIRSIKPFLSAVSRTAEATVEVYNPDYALKPGMYANVNIELPVASGLMVPVSAISHQAGTSGDHIFIIQNNLAHIIAIRQLQTMHDTAIVEGITTDMMIVSSGKTKLREGVSVVVK